MSNQQKNPSPNANHETTIGLKLNNLALSDLHCHSQLSEQILEDFLRPDAEEGLNFPPSHPMFGVIKMEHLMFEQRCLNLAGKFVEGYDGGMWSHNEDGIYCIQAEPTHRFHVSNAYNYSDEYCNPLETGLALTLIALDGSMNSANDKFARAMIYFRSRLMQLIEEQYEDENTILNTSKVIRIID